MNVLVVTNPFAGHKTGDRITDPAEIAAVRAGEQSHHVVATDKPAPKSNKTKED